MWKMFESDFFDCGDDACDGPGPPPKFHLPPPPRPPFMQDLNAVLGTTIECSEDGLFDLDVCAAIPNFDANFRNNSMLQTSAIIAVCSIFVLLVILFSSLFLWKHKRKMPNFWPCKSLPKRNGHLDTSGVSTGGHSVAYEDPDAHLHHHPLVRHHNMEMLHPKTIHFPSGYPISRSPPVFVCASPGPDPYRSLDNVYEELGPRDSDIESEPRVQSDDDFAEDELSLNGGAAQPYHISSTVPDGVLATATTSIPMATSTSTCAAISQTIPSISSLYNECLNSAGNASHGSDNNNGDSNHLTTNPNEMERTSNDRHSLISSSSSSASTAPVNDGAAGNSNSSFSSGPTRIASPDSGLALRNRTKRMRNGGKLTPSSPGEMPATANRQLHMENGSIDDTSSESNHLMLPHPYYQSQNHNYNQYRSNNNVELSHSNSNNSSISNQLNSVNNNNVSSRNGGGGAMSNGGPLNGCPTNDVERHNQINKQLSASEHPLIPKFGGTRSIPPTSYQSQMAHANHNNEQMISTIFPGRLINSNTNLNSYNRMQMQNQYYTPSDSVRCSNGSNRSRTNPRSSRHRNTGTTLPYSYQNDNTYSYAEPVFREELASACAPPLHGGYRTISTSNRRPYHSNSHHSSPYQPNYQNFNERDQRHGRPRNHANVASTSTAMNELGHIQPIYSHDSSFGSDSGYSQYTHNSRSKSDGSNSARSGSSNGNGNASTLSNMFSWARRKDQSQSQPSANRNKTNAGKSVPPMRNS